MNGVIEVRTYRAMPGKRAELLALLTEYAFPAQRRLGARIVGPLPSRDDDVTFVWLRMFPDEDSRTRLNTAFYDGPEWTAHLEQQVMPLLAQHDAVLVDDIAGLWDTVPAGRD